MSEEEESANDQIIDNVENMLEALDAVPGQIEDDSNIEISTEERAKSTIVIWPRLDCKSYRLQSSSEKCGALPCSY